MSIRSRSNLFRGRLFAGQLFGPVRRESQVDFGLGDDAEEIRRAVQAHNNAVLGVVAALIDMGMLEWER